MFKIGKIDISIFHFVAYSQLLLLSFPKVVSMNTFLNDAIKIFCFKHLKLHFYTYIFFTFYMHLLSARNKGVTKVIKFDSF